MCVCVVVVVYEAPNSYSTFKILHRHVKLIKMTSSLFSEICRMNGLYFVVFLLTYVILLHLPTHLALKARLNSSYCGQNKFFLKCNNMADALPLSKWNSLAEIFSYVMFHANFNPKFSLPSVSLFFQRIYIHTAVH